MSPRLLIFLLAIRGFEGFSGMTMRRHLSLPTKQRAINVEIDPQSAKSESWKLQPALQILQKGGVGIIPTDTSYAFACDVHSRQGVERIFALKNVQRQKKPLSLLCKDISTISKYTAGVDKNVFRILKQTLPGPYTFILPATHEVPRVFLEHKHHRRTWKRREVGVRVPDDPVCLEILSALDSPLLCSSVPVAAAEDPVEDEGEDGDVRFAAGEGEIDSEAERLWGSRSRLANDPAVMYERWAHAVDFVVDRGPFDGAGGLSTVVSLMGEEPAVLREGAGDPRLVLGG